MRSLKWLSEYQPKMLKSDRSDKSARRLHLHPYGDCTETDKNVEYDGHVFFQF
jgi:hypothetical protein